MTARSFLTLLALTVVVVLAAVLAHTTGGGTDRLPMTGERAFPALEDGLESVTQIAVETAESRFVVKRGGHGEGAERGWVAASHYGYPARETEVNALLVELASLELIARKTARPDLHRRLAVDAPDRPDALGRRVTLRDAQGAILADLIVGRQRHRRTGERDRGTYVRRPGEDRAYLAAGFLDLSDRVYPWLRSKLFDVDPDRIERIDIRPVAGRRLLAIRPREGMRAMGIAGLAEGSRIQVPKVRKLPKILRGIRFDDVKPQDRVNLGAPQSLARVATFDGLRVRVRVHRVDGDDWLTFRVEAAPDAETAVKEALGAQRERLHGWAFRVAPYLAERFSRSLDTLLDAGDG